MSRDVRHRLRRDLVVASPSTSRRSLLLVVDDIAGRFTRVTEDLWLSLCCGEGTDEHYKQARHAGWTRERSAAKGRSISPLSIRIPLGSIDRPARWLAPVSGFIFSRLAICVWTVVIVIAWCMLVGRWEEFSSSLGSLSTFLAQTNPVALAACFVLTKIVHELAHAVMCRRVGSRCGSFGVLLLCGMPCPYCDVSDTSRQPSAWDRASVMLAGIYVEFIVAAIATFVWIGSHDREIALHAMNLIVVCGISTLVFNANPMMRYDGYFVLSDAIGSVNLRAESRIAFRDIVVARIAGWGYQYRRRMTKRLVGLSMYHAVSTLYRAFVLVVIAGLLLNVADRFNLRLAMATLITAVAAMMLIRIMRRPIAVARGTGTWAKIPVYRRILVGLVLPSVLLFLLFLPMPRARWASGYVDASNASTIFLPEISLIDRVFVNFGDRVAASQLLVSLSDEPTQIERVKLSGQLRSARFRSQMSRRATMNYGDQSSEWDTLDAVEDAMQVRLRSVQNRLSRLDVQASVAGVVLPTKPTIKVPKMTATETLVDRVGTLANPRSGWCRISPDGKAEAVLNLDARDRRSIRTGCRVRIQCDAIPDQVFDSVVESVSPMVDDPGSVVRRSTYRVVCPLSEFSLDQVLGILGTRCQAVVRMPPRSLAADLWDCCTEGLIGT